MGISSFNAIAKFKGGNTATRDGFQLYTHNFIVSKVYNYDYSVPILIYISVALVFNVLEEPWAIMRELDEKKCTYTFFDFIPFIVDSYLYQSKKLQ